jgi:hypothetical protein
MFLCWTSKRKKLDSCIIGAQNFIFEWYIIDVQNFIFEWKYYREKILYVKYIKT